jgi:SAM-dependent methyltransferase
MASTDSDGIQTCRFCAAPLRHTLVDLGMSPLCESYVPAGRLDAMEPFYPLHVRICESCLLAQVGRFIPAEDIFTEYAYFSSYSDSWVRHAGEYVDMAVGRFGLGPASRVVEVGSNDGYLLQHFVERGIPVLGIEPARNVAEQAERRGVPTLVRFLGADLASELAAEGKAADLVVANNVWAQVPDLNEFTEGLSILLAPDGVLTLEFPHLVRLVEGRQFDTIYHEHFSYFSFTTACRVLEAHGLSVFDVEELSTHGGSLRVYAHRSKSTAHPRSTSVAGLLGREEAEGFTALERYGSFTDEVAGLKRDLLDLLISIRRDGGTVAGYGAPGKGNTLLNYCGIRTDLLAYTVDRNPYKQGKFLPGTHIPIHAPERLAQTRPDYILVLPWNLRDEILEQLSEARAWGARFILPIPKVEVVS